MVIERISLFFSMVFLPMPFTLESSSIFLKQPFLSLKATILPAFLAPTPLSAVNSF
jgi:hypothetical protein